jgi:hypothetical protein
MATEEIKSKQKWRMLAPCAIFTIAVYFFLLYVTAAAQNLYSISKGGHESSSIAGGSPTATPTPTCASGWSIVPSPNTGPDRNFLSAVSALSSNDVWAVGSYSPGPSGPDRTLIEHWDGSQWSIVPSPSIGASGNVLHGVSALTSNDVWAVGDYHDSTNRTLILHWDGAQWSVVPSPNASERMNFLSSVLALSHNDVWAVGYYYTGTGTNPPRTLILHWNGTQWSIVPSPNSGTEVSLNTLSGIDAYSSTDVWVVGSYTPDSGGRSRTLILHWDGIQWAIVPSPNNGSGSNSLASISVVTSNDAWAAGSYNTGPDTQYLTLLLHWNGTQWTIIPSPSIGSGYNYLAGVSAVTSNDVWAVGGYYDASFVLRTQTQHWNGTQWSVVPSPNNGTDPNFLYDVSALSSGDVWAVGEYGPAYQTKQTLVERYTSSCVTVSPTPGYTRTSTPISTNTPGPTNTPVPVETNTPVPVPSGQPTNTSVPRETNTPVPLPTTCSIQFSDVPLDNTFYEAIRCLACRSIVSGYTDGTFRPNNQVTRGQLAKIVSNAAGFTEPVSGQTFQDVPTNHTFYEWIERLTTRGYMTGYRCGGLGEPCLNNRPYFRPFADATRGQAAKIVSNAAGYVEVPTEQTFEDVFPTHTFYREIQRLASRNIMGGYPCGGPSEPCITGKPYFRPQNNVTRGQSAKILANTYFPDCQTP